MLVNLNSIIRWLACHITEIFLVFQALLFVVSSVVYPCFETFLIIVVWLDLLLLFYFFIYFDVPLLFLTVGLFFVFRSISLFNEAPMLAGGVFLFILTVMGLRKLFFKNSLLTFKFFNEFKNLEENILTKFKLNIFL